VTFDSSRFSPPGSGVLGAPTLPGLLNLAPFGLKTEYDPSWAGRYIAIKPEMKTMGFNPVVAYKINDAFSFGPGVVYQNAETELTNAINFEKLCT
jgi:long-chain fatty acid transport protein